MTVQEHKLYARWLQVQTHRDQRQKFYDALGRKYPKKHEIMKNAQAKLDEAIAEYDAIASEL